MTVEHEDRGGADGDGGAAALREELVRLRAALSAAQRDAERGAIGRAVLEACPTGMILSETDGTIVLANAEAHRIFGCPAGELVGTRIEALVPQPSRDRHPHERAAYLESPHARMMGKGQALRAVRRDGSEFPVEIGLTPIPTRSGLLVLSVVVDITERSAVEEVLRRHRQELERSNAELEQFAYVASHDLQEPLRMVASYTELLAERYKGRLDDRADKYIRYAVDGAKRMQRLVADLLLFSRVGTQGRPLAVVAAGDVARAVVEEMAVSIAAAGATVEIGPIPSVLADELQLRQVYQNLIGNAVKFRGDAPPRVRISAEPQGAFVRFLVADNGIGVEPEYADRIFKMFHRLHDRGKYEGNGIGLAVAKKIVERHGGRIGLTSTPGAGTTFHFTLPAATKDPT